MGTVLCPRLTFIHQAAQWSHLKAWNQSPGATAPEIWRARGSRVTTTGTVVPPLLPCQLSLETRRRLARFYPEGGAPQLSEDC